MKKSDRKSYITALATASMLFLIFDCQPPPPTDTDPGHEGWVEKGGGFFPGDQGSAIYGVGSVDDPEKIGTSMSRTASETGARADIARSIHSHVEDLVTVYQGLVRDASAAEVDEWVRTATISFTEMDLVGAEIVDHHNCTRDNALYALARMDVNSYNDTVEKMEKLSDRAKDSIKEQAQEMFDEMARRSAQTP